MNLSLHILLFRRRVAAGVSPELAAGLPWGRIVPVATSAVRAGWSGEALAGMCLVGIGLAADPAGHVLDVLGQASATRPPRVAGPPPADVVLRARGRAAHAARGVDHAGWVARIRAQHPRNPLPDRGSNRYPQASKGRKPLPCLPCSNLVRTVINRLSTDPFEQCPLPCKSDISLWIT